MVATRASVPSRLGATALPEAAGGPFLTVQVGAFAHESTARLHSARLASKYNVRVVPISRNGQRLFAVRVGQFSSRSTADALRQEIGGAAIVTAATGE